MARGNPNNLISNAELTPEERVKSARKAGKASGEARRNRKTMKEALLAILDTPGEDGMTLRESIVAAIVKRAKTGDITAFTTIRDTIGEKPADKQEIDSTVRVVMDKDTEDFSG